MSVITSLATINTVVESVVLSRMLWSKFFRHKIGISYGDVKNRYGKTGVLFPSKEDMGVHAKFDSYVYKVINNSLSDSKKYKADCIIPVPMIFMLGLKRGKQIKVVNNSTFKSIKYFGKSANWIIDKQTNSNIVVVCDNKSIVSKHKKVNKISLDVNGPRGSITNRNTLEKLRTEFLSLTNEIKNDVIDLYLECSPVSAYEIGIAFKDSSKKVNLYHFNGNEYVKMIVGTSQNSFEFVAGIII